MSRLKSGAFVFRTKLAARQCLAGAHELALELHDRRPFFQLIAEIFEVYVEIRHEHPVFRRRGLVHESELAVLDRAAEFTLRSRYKIV